MSVPPAQVVRHESEIGRWEMVSQAATPRLRRHVLGYCGYEEETVGFTRRRELPSGEVILIVGFGPKLKTTYPEPGARPRRHAPLVRRRAPRHPLHRRVARNPGWNPGQPDAARRSPAARAADARADQPRRRARRPARRGGRTCWSSSCTTRATGRRASRSWTRRSSAGSTPRGPRRRTSPGPGGD